MIVSVGLQSFGLLVMFEIGQPQVLLSLFTKICQLFYRYRSSYCHYHSTFVIIIIIRQFNGNVFLKAVGQCFLVILNSILTLRRDCGRSKDPPQKCSFVCDYVPHSLALFSRCCFGHFGCSGRWNCERIIL